MFIEPTLPVPRKSSLPPFRAQRPSIQAQIQPGLKIVPGAEKSRRRIVSPKMNP
jgi:hypothetical protein